MVDTAANELSGLNCLKEQPYDLVLLEESLFPDRGLDFIRILTVQNPEISIIVLTNHNNRETAAELIKTGADHYIRKRNKNFVEFIPDLIDDIIYKKARENKYSILLNMKDTLLKEVNHRIKNNFQVLISMIHMQSENSKDEYIKTILNDTQNRIRTMSLIHDQLYKSGNLSRIDFGNYVSNLISDLHRYHTDKSNRIDLKTSLDPVSLNVDDAIHCGLIINELISNALTHAFPAPWKKKAEIGISISLKKSSDIQIEIWDNGRGMPEGAFDTFEQGKGLGLHLVNLLVQNQLNGTIDVKTNGGTRYSIHFKQNH